MSADIEIAGHNKATVRQADFLGNPHSKQGLIRLSVKVYKLLALMWNKQSVTQDTLIVSTALHHAAEGQPVVVIGMDTDLLMLVTRASSDNTVCQFNPGHSRVPWEVLRMSSIQKTIGNLKNNWLFLHAVTGSDTRSAPYQQERKKGYKVLKSNNQLKQAVTVFKIPQANQRTLPKLVKNVCYLCMVPPL